MTALAHLSDRAVLRLSGPDVRDFLQGQITNDVRALAVDAPLYAGHLSPQGKTLFGLMLFADGDDVLVDVAAHQAGALTRRLTMFKLRKQVTITPESSLGVWAVWDDHEATPDPRLAALGGRFIAPAGSDQANATLDDYHARRVALGVPEGDELTDLLWLETNAEELNGVSYTKGCYVGQENTARMHHRSKVNRRLLPLRLPEGVREDAVVTAETEHGPREAGELRGQRHGGVQLAHLRVEHAGANLSADDLQVSLMKPDWLDLTV